MMHLLIGSSSGLGRALAETLAAAGHDLLLVARDARDLDAQCADLRLRYGVHVEAHVCSIQPHTPWHEALAERIAQLEQLDGVFFPLGYTSDNDRVENTPDQVDALLETNVAAIMKIIPLCLARLKAQNRGVIVGIGSVAATRGRSSNVVYAAAKRALASYFESLRHALAGTGIRVQLYELGYLDTPRNDGKRLLFPKASSEAIARTIVANMPRDVGRVTLPRFWFAIRWVVRLLPWRLYRTLQF